LKFHHVKLVWAGCV